MKVCLQNSSVEKVGESAFQRLWLADIENFVKSHVRLLKILIAENSDCKRKEYNLF